MVSATAGVAAASAPHIYVLNNDSVTEFAKGASGDQAPVATIAGPRTGLVTPTGLAVDSLGNVFVGNSNDTLTGYAKDSSGDQAPNTVIGGSNTGLGRPTGLAVDRGQTLFVANNSGCTVTSYPAAGTSNATGNVTPKTSLQGASTSLVKPTGVSIQGETLYVANTKGVVCGGNEVKSAAITEYPSGANAAQSPIVTISGPNTRLDGPSGVAVDSGGNVFVSNKNNSVTEYVKKADGNQAPAAVISGPKTGLDAPSGIAVDAEEDVFVSNQKDNTVTEYGPGANGDQAPIATIRGSRTRLKSPVALAVTPIPPGTPAATTPSAPTIGEASAGNRSGHIAFSPPASTGRLPIVSYTAKAEDLFNGSMKTATGQRSPITVPDLNNGDRYAFSVSANNILGSSPYSSRSSVVIPLVSTGIQGDGSNEKPYVAACDDSKRVDCEVSFKVVYVGANRRGSVHAYRCPSSHPYLLANDYAPFGTKLPKGVQIIQPESPWPIGISISGTSTTRVNVNGRDRDVYTGTTTGFPNSSLTNWSSNEKPFKVVLHCTSEVTHGSAQGGRVL